MLPVEENFMLENKEAVKVQCQGGKVFREDRILARGKKKSLFLYTVPTRDILLIHLGWGGAGRG